MKRHALITGGTRGIGLGIARALAGEGWNLVLNGMRPESAVADVLAELRAAGVTVAYAPGDIGSSAGRETILAAVRRATGGAALNLLVNNAGVAPRVRLDLLETTEESYDFVVDTNLKGVFFLTQAVARDMVAARQADPAFPAFIITISSVSATMASVNRGEYCIAKAGLAMLSQLFAARLGPAGILVYEIRPGVIATDMTAGVKTKYDNLIAQGAFVQPRWGTPEDVGRTTAALARGDLPYSTGSVLLVDGGLSLPRL